MMPPPEARGDLPRTPNRRSSAQTSWPRPRGRPRRSSHQYIRRGRRSAKRITPGEGTPEKGTPEKGSRLPGGGYSCVNQPLLRSPPASCFAVTASSSARSFPVLWGPLAFWCPLTFLHRTSWWRCVASRSLSHRSLFATGSLRWLSHPFSRHFLYQPLLMQLTKYDESE